MTRVQFMAVKFMGFLWLVLFGIALLAMYGCVVIGDYRPHVSASIGTGGAGNQAPERHPYIADDLQEAPEE